VRTALVLALVLLSACARTTGYNHAVVLEREKKVETTRGDLAQRTLTPEEQQQAARCKHAWVQHAWHLVEDPSGPGATQICVITRCALCGEIRHECGIGRKR
jgi:hypothetical protein